MSNDKLLPHIMVLGTGGTIASTANDATNLSEYKVTEDLNSLLAEVPDINELANIEYQQVFNVDSHDITSGMVLRLAVKVDEQLADDGVDGVVITHGTDTLEETAYFLNLVIKSCKPVVLVGAMRPGSAISADGPLNIYNAVVLASNRDASNHGVLVLLNDRVYAARFVNKCNTTQVDAFGSPEHGSLGRVYNKRLYLYQTPIRAHTTATCFCLREIQRLPLVDIIYDHQSAGIHHYKSAIEAGASGIVVAACGNGSMSEQARQGVQLAVDNKIVCVRSSRVGSGCVTRRAGDDELGLVSGDSLNPQKARILLMLALSQTSDLSRVQSYFDCY